jgi:hypothetical protein
MVVTEDPNALYHLATGLPGLAGRLDTARAAKAADALVRRMAQTDDLAILSRLADGFKAVAGRLDAGQAAAHAGKTVNILVGRLDQTDKSFELRDLAERVAAVAGWLDAARASNALDALLAVMSKTTDQDALAHLAGGLGALAGRLDAAGVGKALDGLITLTSKTKEWKSLRPTLKAMGAALGRLGLTEHSQRACAVSGTLASLAARSALPTFPALLEPAVQPVPPPLPAQTLVNLLKHPLCVGPARRLVLDQLQRHYGRPFADQWDFVRFVRERPDLNLDLTSPPRRS